MAITRRASFAIIGIFGFYKRLNAQVADAISVEITLDQEILNKLSPKELRFIDKIEPDNSDNAKLLAEKIPPGRAPPVILIIVGTIALVRLSEMILEMTRKYYFGGVIVDLRGRKPKIYNDARMPAEIFIVIDKDGRHTYQTQSVSLDFIAKIFKGGFSK